MFILFKYSLSVHFVFAKKRIIIMTIVHISGAKGWGGNVQKMIYCILELEKFGCKSGVFGLENPTLGELYL
jgi:hypothetical protein